MLTECKQKENNFVQIIKSWFLLIINTMKTKFLLPALIWFTFCLAGQNVNTVPNNYFLDGVYEEYFTDGNLKQEISFNNGILDGKIISYFDNGKVKEIKSFKNGLLHGIWITFNQEGKVSGKANFKNGKKHGKWVIYDLNGNKCYEIAYKNGAKLGTASNLESSQQFALSK